jgi:hypothetical protein
LAFLIPPDATPSGAAASFFGGVHTYDPRMVQVIVGVLPIIGFGPDTLIKMTRSKDTFRKLVGCHGEVTRIMDKDTTGELTIDLMQTSESNISLSTLQYIDELGKFAVVPILVVDLSGGSFGLSMSGWIRKPPEMVFNKGLELRRWTFDLATVDVVQLGNLAFAI